jgi:hypothetical protein
MTAQEKLALFEEALRAYTNKPTTPKKEAA